MITYLVLTTNAAGVEPEGEPFLGADLFRSG